MNTKGPRVFEIMQGSRKPETHPAIQLQQVWSIADPEGDAIIDFVELRGHWCSTEAVAAGHLWCPHNDVEPRRISVQVQYIVTVEEVHVDGVRAGVFYWVFGRPAPIYVAAADNAVAWSSSVKDYR